MQAAPRNAEQARGGEGSGWNRIPAELLFVVSAVAQYTGTAIAIKQFARVSPIGVAWLRAVGSSLGFGAIVWASVRRRGSNTSAGITDADQTAVASEASSGEASEGGGRVVSRVRLASPGDHRSDRRLFGRWSRSELQIAAGFGVVIVLMNGFFFLAINRLPLGKGVAIEFLGPIAVAASRTKSRRNGLALGCAVAGVVVLSGTLTAEPLGLAFILAASSLWAGYIVLAARVVEQDRGAQAIGIGLGIAAVVLAPIGIPTSLPAFHSVKVLALCLLVGLLSNVIGYGIDQFVLRSMSTRRFAVMLSILPVTATLIGMISLSQTPSFVDLVGIGLVLVGLVIQDRT